MIIFYAVAIGAAILSLVWALTARPSAARANLMAGLDVPGQPISRTARVPSLGQGCVGRIPRRPTQGPGSRSRTGRASPGPGRAPPAGLKLVLLFGVTVVFVHPSWAPVVGPSVAWPVLPARLLAGDPAGRSGRTAHRNDAADTIDQLTHRGGGGPGLRRRLSACRVHQRRSPGCRAAAHGGGHARWCASGPSPAGLR